MRTFIITAVTIIFSFQASAQKIFVGPEIGLNLINVQEQEIGDNFQPGLYAGAAVDYQFFDWLSLRTGVYCSQSRHSYSSEDTSALDLLGGLGGGLGGLLDSSFAIPGIDMNTYTSIEGRRSHYSIQIPIQANFSWKNIQLFVGGYVGFMIAGSQKQKTIERSPLMETIDLGAIDPSGFISAFLPPAYAETHEETSGTEGFRVFDYGLKFGLGYQLKEFGVQASYSFGIPDYRNDNEGEDLRANRFFQFSVRYMLPIGKGEARSSIR
ncbi:MAG: outer membrane beta-barrel protein [Crocinitomicaceae bacterium]|nr:outer membrane beta-barrel protein [Crocinitomicaceae bacterium]